MYQTPRQVARRFDVAEGTIYRLVRTGILPAFRPVGVGHGRAILIDSDVAEEVMRARLEMA